ncbi:MAG: DNA recombination protein RmuC [Muribaculaceae bacterium]|nr:DNA recombination protein RmuC [Muribaculaceae bacterium]
MNVYILIISLLAIAIAVMVILHQRRFSAADAAFRRQLESERETVSSLRVENASLKASLVSAEQDVARERASVERLRAENGSLAAVAASLKERVAINQIEHKEQELAVADRFRNLANEIFSSHAAAFKQSSEQRLNEILSPLKADIDKFRQAVDAAYSDEAKERFSLRNEIRNLMELNRSIGKEAQDLTRALKGDSKIQGDWGEMILERLLEMSGLRKGCHFRTQVTTDEDGTRLSGENGQLLRPDVVVFYPDGRCVVVDSKVSLNAYIDYVNAETDSPEQADAAKRHLVSVRRHIDELARKRYQDLVGEKRLDFVMMFIPNEGAYMATMKLDQSIWQEAYEKRVLLTSPTHLISVLRMLEQLWKQDAINRNVQEIARLSGTMVDKIVSFMSDLDEIRKAVSMADSAYERARKRLCDGHGNVLVTARKIVALGARSSKGGRLRQYSPEDDESDLTAIEG